MVSTDREEAMSTDREDVRSYLAFMSERDRVVNKERLKAGQLIGLFVQLKTNNCSDNLSIKQS